MKPFAAIPARLPRSGIREVMDLAWEVERSEPVIHLEVGQPDFATPEHIVEATTRFVREGHTKYVPNAGVRPLREAFARYVQRKTGVATSEGNVLITPGAVMSLATAFTALLEPGDEVLVPDPGWPNYVMTVTLVHGIPVPYPVRPENSFLPDPDEIEKLITPRTKLLMLCSPSNPTGQVYGADLMKRLMDLASRHDLYVLSDEIYADIVFENAHASALPHDPDRVLLVGGVSKSYAMTGYRVGFTRARPEYIELAAKLQEAFISCGTGFSQLAAAVALDGPQDAVEQMRRAYQARRDVALGVLRERGLYRYTPGGAFYLLVDISAARMDSYQFMRELLKRKKVAVAPGSTFGDVTRNYVRISIASSEENIREGLRRLCDLIDELKT
jgi:aspartate aminotransferase/aminotransferase